ncbi:MAG: hypothetical protein QM820_57275 [Minicystis sp.]
MTERPRVERMVMFKHGVAYLERRGPAEGAFELTFRREEMNDVLKSLAVWVARGEAQVGGIGFEAPEDPDDALAERKLLLPPGEALTGLIRSLRGRRVSVDDGQARHDGEVIGVEETPGGEGPPRRMLLLRKAGSAEDVALIDLASARGLVLREEPSQQNLAFIVDRGRAGTSGENRIVRIAVHGRAEDLRVSYVIPAPTWRVSYRMVHEGEETLLLAMGIVHNPVDEDLDDVALTLTTGQPVSFVMDLYNPKKVERAVVEETSRAAAAPIRYEGEAKAKKVAPPAAAAPAGPARMRSAVMVGAAASAETSFGDALAGSASGAAVGADRGELFEYRVASRVSLKRGGSAMVPLVSARVRANKERIWRDRSGPNPDLAITFKNDTGVVLEEGPTVIYDENVYAGESMVPYSARGVEVKLGYAKDLAVRCQRSTQYAQVFTGLKLDKNGVVQELRNEETRTISAESDHDEPVDLIVELPRQRERTLETEPPFAKPFATTASFWRFKVTVPPHGKAEFQVRTTAVLMETFQYEGISVEQIRGWRKAGRLDERTLSILGAALALSEQARQLDHKAERLADNQKAAYAKQEKISAQLAVLKEGGPEGSLRLRYVKELEAEQDKINEAEKQIAAVREEAEQKRAESRAKLAEVRGGAGSA